MKKIKLEYIFIAIIMTIIIGCRATWFHRYFAHYDDIHVAKSLFTFQADIYSEKFQFLRNIGKIGSLKNQISVFIFYMGSWSFGIIINLLYTLVKFSSAWTYAPAQFIMTNGLLKFASDYNGILFWGRLPSLMFGVGSLFLIWKYGHDLEKNNTISILGVCILGFSWQSIIYCMHMSNYESIIFVGISALIMLRKYALEDCAEGISLKPFIALAAMTYVHYQMLLYFTAFIATMFICDLIRKVEFKKLMKKYVIAGSVYVISIIPMLRFVFARDLASAGLNWNVGIEQQYYFKSLGVSYAIHFFTVNTYKVFSAMMSPSEIGSLHSNIIVFVYLVLFIIGIMWNLVSFFRKKTYSVENLATSIFIIMLMLIQYTLTVLGKVTLSPTRHSNFLIPIFIAGILLGAQRIYGYLKGNKSVLVNMILCLMILNIFVVGFNDIKTSRIDKFSQAYINDSVVEYDPAVVVGYNWTPQVWGLMQSNPYYGKLMEYAGVEVYKKQDTLKSSKNIIFMSHRSELGKDKILEVAEKLLESNVVTPEEYNKIVSNDISIVDEYKSDIEVDFDNTTRNGSNGLYVYLLNYEN